MILRYLNLGGRHSARSITAYMAQAFQVEVHATRAMLSYLCQSGVIERVARGWYQMH